MNNIDYDIFIKGEQIDLVVLSEETVEKTNWYRWVNDEEITEYMQQHYYPNTKELQLKYFKDQIENNSSIVQLGIVNKINSILIGMVSLKNIDLQNRSAEISIIIGEKKYHNLDHFIESCKLMIRHGFDTLGLNRIYSGSFSKDIDNLFCRVLSFNSEGTLKKAVYKKGIYHDVYLCAIINDTQLSSK